MSTIEHGPRLKTSKMAGYYRRLVVKTLSSHIGAVNMSMRFVVSVVLSWYSIE